MFCRQRGILGIGVCCGSDIRIYESACKDRLRSVSACSTPIYRSTGYMDTNAYGSTYAHMYTYRICTIYVLDGR